MKKIRIDQAAKFCTEMSKTKFFPVSIVNCQSFKISVHAPVTFDKFCVLDCDNFGLEYIVFTQVNV